MASTSADSTASLSSFARFSKLPVEIRCQIWSFAAPTRTRVVQVSYNPETAVWQACIDSCGGLPPIIPACREARQEALKSCTRMFETWVDLDQDIIFVSDPLFTIRAPRKSFMASEHIDKIKWLAFTDDVYLGLMQTHEDFPDLTESPATVIRNMRGVEYFALVLMEDGGGFDGDDSDGEEFEFEDAESVASADVADEGDEEDHDEQEAYTHETEEGLDSNQHHPVEDEDEDDATDPPRDDALLLSQEDEAMEGMSKGYFRHVGDVHLVNAMSSSDHWDSWRPYLEQISLDFKEMHETHPEWTRPKVAITEVKYGLNGLGYSPSLQWREAESIAVASADKLP